MREPGLRREAARRRRRRGRGWRRGLGPWIGPGSATPWRGSARSVRGSPACDEREKGRTSLPIWMAFGPRDHSAHDRPNQPTSKRLQFKTFL
jgi:hypothetical protein